MERVVAAYREGRIGRRAFVRGVLAMGLSVPAAGVLLAACARERGEDPLTSGAAGAASGRVQVLVGFGTGNAPEQVREQEALAAAFAELNPDATIEFVRVPSGSADAQQRLTLAISAGEAPDLVMPTGLYGLGLFLDREVWLDVGPLAERDGIDLAQYREEPRQAARATDFYGADSQALVGLPVGMHTHVLAYNATLFDQVGVSPPPADWRDDSWTYERFRDTAIALTRDEAGRTPDDRAFDPDTIAHYGVGNFFPETVFFAFGGRRWIANEQAFGFDGPGAIAGLRFAADLINRDRAQPNAQAIASIGGGAAGGEGELFAWTNGRLAMVDFCTCGFASYGQADGFDWAFAAMPAGPERRFAFLNLDLGAITQAAANPEGAWEVLKFFAIDRAEDYAFGALGAIPPRTGSQDVFSAFVTKGYPNADPAVVEAALPFSGTDNEAWHPAFAEVNTAYSEAVGPVIAGEADAEPALHGLQAEATRLAEQWFAANDRPLS